MHPSNKQQKIRPSKWIENRYQPNYWKTKEGRQICLQDDVCLCVTTLEDDIMRRHAVVKLSGYGILIHFTKLEKIQTKYSITSIFEDREKDIFGIPIEKAYQIEKQLHHYPQVRINAQYKSHIPHFFLATIRSVAEYGMNGVDILDDEGRTLRTNLMQQQLRQGEKLVYDLKEDCSELSMLMRIFLRDLSEGLLTEELEVFFGYTAKFTRLSAQVEVLQYLIQVLPRANRETLFLTISLCRKLLFNDKGQYRFRKMIGVFTRLIFRSEHKINGIGSTVVKLMIRNIDSIFTLKAVTLNAIYQQIDIFHPKKLDAALQLRVSQNLWTGSDIPSSLWILTHQGRSFELMPLEKYVMNNEGEQKTQELKEETKLNS